VDPARHRPARRSLRTPLCAYLVVARAVASPPPASNGARAEVQVTITKVDRLNDDKILVEYSDGTTAVYTAPQLATLTPVQVADNEDGDAIANPPA
jgi:hypothetical protein